MIELSSVPFKLLILMPVSFITKIINTKPQKMKLLTLTALLGMAFSYTIDECSHDREVMCIHDINTSYPICQKAAQ